MHRAVEKQSHRQCMTEMVGNWMHPNKVFLQIFLNIYVTPSKFAAKYYLDFNSVDYEIWGSCRIVWTTARCVTSISWSRAQSRVGSRNLHQVFIDEAILQWRPRLWSGIRANAEDILNTDFSYVRCLHTLTATSSRLLRMDTLCFGVTLLNSL